MSQFYDQASLVMVPSGYKSGKIYSQKPLSTSGELSFSRASNATRVVLDASGQQRLEKVRTNLLTYSNDFSNAAWIKSNAAVTSGQSGYDGTSNAWKLTPNTSNSSHYTYANIVTTGLLTFSAYVKPDGYNFVLLYAGGYGGTFFDISTGLVGGNLGSAPSATKIEAAGNGFYRCSITVPSSADVAIFAANTISNYAFTGNGTSGVLIQSAQYETGDIATDYIATTSTAVSVGPVSGLPRLDYSGGASCPALKLEPQRTNVITFSESINNAAWGIGGVTITGNQTTSPSGYVDADLMTEDTSTGEHVANQSPSTTASAWAWSAFMKSNGKEWVYLRIADSGNIARYAYFNLLTGTVGSVAGQFTSATITDYGNGWYRCEAVIGTARNGNSLPRIGLAGGDGVYSYTGDGTSGAYVWGAQLELGAYSTSLIPTLSSAVTRVADAAYKTGIASLIGQSEGTIFLEVERAGGVGFENLLFLGDGALSNFVNVVYDNSVNRYKGQVRSSGTTGGVVTAQSAYTGKLKIAVAYAANNLVLYINGVLQQTDTSVTLPSATLSVMAVGSYYTTAYGTDIFRGDFNQMLLFKTRLSNADLATLTTL